jgi:hypothetical protein
MRTSTRRDAVTWSAFAFLSAALVMDSACVASLEDLAPFPCARDGSCPSNFYCDPKAVCRDCAKDPTTGAPVPNFCYSNACDTGFSAYQCAPQVAACDPSARAAYCYVDGNPQGFAQGCSLSASAKTWTFQCTAGSDNGEEGSACPCSLGYYCASNVCVSFCSLRTPSCETGSCNPIDSITPGPVVDGVLLGVCTGGVNGEDAGSTDASTSDEDSVPSDASADDDSGACAEFDVTGPWTGSQSNGIAITFEFTENGQELGGTAAYSGGRGAVSGTNVNNKLDFTVSWSSGIQGHYSGTVTGNSLSGTTTSNGAHASWTATGSALCMQAESIVGTWSETTNGSFCCTVVYTASSNPPIQGMSSASNGNQGTWVSTGNTITTTWSASVDTITLSTDGNSFSGSNNQGVIVDGARVAQ